MSHSNPPHAHRPPHAHPPDANPPDANPPDAAQSPATAGHTIHWAWLYDIVVWIMSWGQDRALRQWTVKLAALQPGEAVLDVGCGTGDLTLAAKARVGAGRVIGLDAAAEMIAVARRKAARRRVDVDFRVGLVEATGLPAHSCDVVLSSLMLHHLPGDLKRAGLVECRRVLKPGGRLVAVDFVRPAEGRRHGGMGWSAHPTPPQGAPDLAALLAEAGFVDVTAGAAPFASLGYACGRAPADGA